MFQFSDPQFREIYRKTPAREFARFLSRADKGVPRAVQPPRPLEGAAARELEDVEAGFRWNQAFLATP